MKRQATASSFRVVDDIIDHQGDIVEKLDEKRRAYDRWWNVGVAMRAVAREHGKGPKILRSCNKLPFQRLADLAVATVDPMHDLFSQRAHLALKADISDH